ncbi:MAG: DUF11 domain-containing protein [Flavobacteriales bacterium]|nr:DUF11 domain-containing protein [Flavobacteriales bacterium]
MIRSTCLLTSLLSLSAAAQSVFIPDEDLQVFLYGKCAACMDTVSGMMDVAFWNAAPSALNIPLSLAQDGHLDLTGIDQLIVPALSFDYAGGTVPTLTFPAYPQNLGSLDVDELDFAQFPDVATLTNAFTSFGCSGCEITDIPPFTSPISAMNLTGVNLSAGANEVPPTVTNLFMQACQLTSCPSLPVGLQYCSIGSNTLTSLPSVLPPNLIWLHVPNNNISVLPDLPPSLTSLSVGNTPISSLPPLPAGLAGLTISGTQIIDQLPPLPPGLTSLIMAQMQADVMPDELPSTLQVLFVQNSPIASIPELPDTLYRLLANGTPSLTCLPLLPDDLTELTLSGSGVACLPNIPAGPLAPQDVGIPLVVCDPTASCPLFDPLVTGTVFRDLDSDGVQGVDDPPLPNAIVRTIPGSILTASGADGRYVLPISTGPYTVDGIPLLYHTITTAPHAVDLTGPAQIDSLNDIGYHGPSGIIDLRVSALTSTPMVPGFEGDVWFTVKNVGTEPVSAEITFTLDPSLTWQTSVPVATDLNGNTGTWSIATIGPNELLSFSIGTYADPAVAAGTPFTSQASAVPAGADVTPLDNFRLLNGTIVSSYDPNDKRVEPTALTPTQVAAGTTVTYTIRFQNTGTFPAQRVVVMDSLRSGLQAPTFQFLGSSHTCSWHMLHGTVYFVFDNIQLPDSTTDAAGSHGYVQFSVVPRTDLTLGEQVTNEAYIYFDFNEPILTEPAVLTMDASTLVKETAAEQLHIWPDPVDDRLYVECPSGTVLEVLDMTGRPVLRERSNTVLRVVDVHTLAPGRYVVRVAGAGARSFIKR